MNSRCDMGVGCQDVGVCYAEANGCPERCSKIDTSTAALRATADYLSSGAQRSPDHHRLLEAARTLRAVAEEKEAQAVPQGWKLVPLEVTEKMLAAVPKSETQATLGKGRRLPGPQHFVPKDGHCPVLTAEREEAGRNVQAFVESQGGIGERPMIPVWLPIETAPRDGTEIIGRYMHIDTIVVHNIFWMPFDEDWPDNKEGWWTYTHSDVSRELLSGWRAPTHWMPLHKGPKT